METILSAPSMSNLKKYPSKQPRQTQCKKKNHNNVLILISTQNFLSNTQNTTYQDTLKEESVEYDTIKQFNYISLHLLLHNMP